MGEELTSTAVFQYNLRSKLRFAFIVYGAIFLIALFALSYYLFLRDADIAFFEFFSRMITHIKDNIAASSLLGISYAAVFGGLFFVTIPMELVFIGFIRNGANPYFLIIIFLVGFLISFTLNYLVGMKLDTLAKKVISPKKFFKVKGVLNKHGPLAIFFFNVVPFLPSQPLSTILGVFRYNKAKFYVYFLLGQAIKFIVIALGYIYIFGQ